MEDGQTQALNAPIAPITEPANISPIERPTLHSAVVNRLRDMITDGQLPPGMRIHEGQLGPQLGVSRTPLREALDSFVDSTQKNVTGKVTLWLYRCSIRVLDRVSPNSLYDTSIGSFVMGADYDQKDAEGFIKLNALRMRIQAGKGRKLK